MPSAFPWHYHDGVLRDSRNQPIALFEHDEDAIFVVQAMALLPQATLAHRLKATAAAALHELGRAARELEDPT